MIGKYKITKFKFKLIPNKNKNKNRNKIQKYINIKYQIYTNPASTHF